MDVNWTQIGWGCVFGLVIGLLVYAIGSFLDWCRDRKFRELTGGEPWDITIVSQRKDEESDADGA